MEVGVFIPIGNNGWLLSENAPQYRPTFELNKQVVLAAEKYGLDFALSMIKLRGFGGKTEFWDHNLKSFTLMADSRRLHRLSDFSPRRRRWSCRLPSSRGWLRRSNSISNGRFGLNVITGWQRPEYSQMGMWPGDEYFAKRYQYLSEYVEVLRELWATGRSDFKGQFFKMDDCRVSPRPQAAVKIICAGQSDAGLAFTAKYADYNFALGKGINTPTAFAPVNERLKAATDKTGRSVASYLLFMIIAEETDDAAMAKWEHIKSGADHEAIAWLAQQGAADKTSGADTNVRQLTDLTSAVNLNMGTLVGSYASVARMLDEIAMVPGTGGVLLTFDDFLKGITNFGERIQPLMVSRKNVKIPEAA